MLIVGICDGDANVRAMLAGFIRRYREETGENIQSLSYDSGEKLIHHYPLDMDIIFLEIPLSKISGIEIAKRVKGIDLNVNVVFLTSFLNYVLEAYDAKADSYIMKPLKYERFLQEVEISKQRKGNNRFFLEHSQSGIYKVYTKTIKYIETIGQSTCIHTEIKDIVSGKRMKAHEEILFEEYFFRCHSGFIVNLIYLDRLEGNEMRLITGEIIPVSRHRKKQLVERIYRFYEGKG